ISSDTNVYARVPTGATSGPITVATAKGIAASTASFTVAPCAYTQADASSIQASLPTFIHFKPASGKPGTTVTITGTSFTGATAVTFGGTKAKFTGVSPTQITATVPKKAKSGKIFVVNGAGAGQSSGIFKVTK